MVKKTTAAQRIVLRDEVAKLVKEVRELGYTTLHLARASGVARQSIHNYISGSSLPQGKQYFLVKEFIDKPRTAQYAELDKIRDAAGTGKKKYSPRKPKKGEYDAKLAHLEKLISEIHAVICEKPSTIVTLPSEIAELPSGGEEITSLSPKLEATN
jgi:predicted transcriptional regulator